LKLKKLEKDEKLKFSFLVDTDGLPLLIQNCKKPKKEGEQKKI
jgi:hypothetical protein